MNRTPFAPSPIRSRVTRDVLWLVVGLIFVFATVIVIATLWHMYQDARIDSQRIVKPLLTKPAAQVARVLKLNNRVSDPFIWVYQNHRLIAHSPNTGKVHPVSSYSGFVWWPNIHLQSRFYVAARQYVVGWPLSADWILIQWLCAALAFLVLMSAVAALRIASWITTRVLYPIHDMVTHVSNLLSAEKIEAIPEPTGGDEFTELAVTFNQLLVRLEAHRQRNFALVGDSAHHLRTPLAVIRGNLDELRHWDTLQKSTRNECLDTIDRTLSDITRITDDLLTLDEALGKVISPMVPVDLRELVRELQEDGQALTHSYGHGLLTWADLSSGASVVWAHEDYLRKALWIVIDNAIKYGTQEEEEVIIQIVSRSSEDSSIIVRDRGPGIPPEELPLVTSRFYRASNARHLSGNGLGLSIAVAVMNAQHGSLELESSASGTLVTLTLRAVRNS